MKIKPKEIAKLVQSGQLEPFGLSTPTGDKITLPWGYRDKPNKLEKLERIDFLRLQYESFCYDK